MVKSRTLIVKNISIRGETAPSCGGQYETQFLDWKHSLTGDIFVVWL